MRYLIFIIIFVCAALIGKAQEMPIRTSDPALVITTNTEAKIPVRNADNSVKRSAAVVDAKAPIRSSDNAAKQATQAHVKLPLRTTDPATVAPQGNTQQKAAPPDKPVTPSEQPIPANNEKAVTTGKPATASTF